MSAVDLTIVTGKENRHCYVHKGRIPLPKSDEFLEKFQTAFDPPLIFGKLYCKFFIMDMLAFMQGGKGQIVSVNIR